MLPTEDKNAAFNLGSDARIKGLTQDAVPYPEGDARRFWWKHGWQNVHYHWGEFVNNRWKIRKIPEIVEQETKLLQQHKYVSKNGKVGHE